MHSSNHISHPSIASSVPWAWNASPAIRRGKLEISDPIPIPQANLDEMGSRVDDGPQGHHSSTSFAKTDTWPRRSTAPALQDFNQQESRNKAVSHASSSYQNTLRSSAALTNTHQSMSSLPSGASVRKSGGIRATFRKMFSSTRRRDTFSVGVNSQRSNSTSLLDQTGPAHPPLRKPSLLFEELIRGRALNSHAPTVVSPEPTQSRDGRAESIRPFLNGFGRRNSLPSVVLSPQEAQGLGRALNQHGIETDYKSPSKPLRRMPHRSLLDTVKRKSRSADALRDMALSQNTLQAQERRLSDEIKYWRNSVIEDPIPSFTHSQEEVREETEATRSDQRQTPTPPASRLSKDLPARPQAFDFGSFVVGSGDASVEQRITTVEVKLIDLECAIANLQDPDTAQSLMLGKPPGRRKAVLDSCQRANARSCSTPALCPKSSFDSSSTDSCKSRGMQDEACEHRNSVATTIWPITAARSDTSVTVAPPPLPAQNFSEDEFARLVSMLSQEQEARRGLENQLKDLQNQINDLRFPAAPHGPPTPGHFSAPASNMLDSPPLSTKRYTVLPFRTASPRMTLRKLPSQKENEGEETDTDDGFSDVYETPTEAREYGFGIEAPMSPLMVGVM